MHETHWCAPARKTWGTIGGCGPWDVRSKSTSCHAIVTCVLSVLCMFFRFLAKYSMNPYVYPAGFGRCPFGCRAGPCRRRKGFGTTYDLSCRSVWRKYRTCRTHKYEWDCLDSLSPTLYDNIVTLWAIPTSLQYAWVNNFISLTCIFLVLNMFCNQIRFFLVFCCHQRQFFMRVFQLIRTKF